MSHLVTGDAVVLGLRPAKLPSRAMAVLVDLAIVVGAYLLISMFLLNMVFSLGEAISSTVMIASLVLILIGVPVASETLSRGRSVGKALLGLRVVRDDGGPVRFRHALVRGLTGFVELLVSFGFIACVSSLVSPQGRRLGDVFAGTMVVRERIPTPKSSTLPPPPPQWAGRFAELDLSRVPDELWLAVRQLLTRMEKLDHAAAWSMAVRMAQDVSYLVGTPPPPELHPAAYLAAVAGERQRRDAERMFGHSAAHGGFGGPSPAHGQGRPADPWAGGPAAPRPGAPAPTVGPHSQAPAAGQAVHPVAPSPWPQPPGLHAPQQYHAYGPYGGAPPSPPPAPSGGAADPPAVASEDGRRPESESGGAGFAPPA